MRARIISHDGRLLAIVRDFMSDMIGNVLPGAITQNSTGLSFVGARHGKDKTASIELHINQKAKT
jgi:hypothetical protein